MTPREDILGRLAIFASGSGNLANEAEENGYSTETVEQIKRAHLEAEEAVQMARAEYEEESDDTEEN